MILIADSGSTKTDWRLVHSNGNTSSYHTIGFNPYHIKEPAILEALQGAELSEIKQKVTQVFFYGSGCSTPQNCWMIEGVLSSFFSQAKIAVWHDMLAVARATCGKEKGMAAILGTGANSCWYDGHLIVENVAALGYVLGDYGSGAHIGKAIVCGFLENELPQEIAEDFAATYQLSVADILNAVYKEALPNRFLATFSRFAAKHINHPFIEQMVTKSLEQFFEKNICKYTNYQQYKLHLVGSVAFVYQNLIREVAKKHGVEVGKIIKAPIEELVNYHTS